MVFVKITIYHSTSKLFNMSGTKNYPAITWSQKITQPILVIFTKKAGLSDSQNQLRNKDSNQILLLDKHRTS